MPRKKYVIAAIVVFAAIAAIAAVLSIQSRKRIKGGKDAYTIYDVESDTLKLISSASEVTLSGEKRESVLAILKSRTEDVNENKADVTYDVKIDFCNSNVGYLSTEDHIFCVESIQKSMSKEDCEYIVSLMEE